MRLCEGAARLGGHRQGSGEQYEFSGSGGDGDGSREMARGPARDSMGENLVGIAVGSFGCGTKWSLSVDRQLKSVWRSRA